MTTKNEKDDSGAAILTTTGAGLATNPLGLVDDPELRAEMESDPELLELSELTAFAAEVRAVVASERRDLIRESDRLQQIEQSVLYQLGILPIAIAEMDSETKRHILDTSAKESFDSEGLAVSDREAALAAANANKRNKSARSRKDGP
jgi:hypothetical protein